MRSGLRRLTTLARPVVRCSTTSSRMRCEWSSPLVAAVSRAASRPAPRWEFGREHAVRVVVDDRGDAGCQPGFGDQRLEAAGGAAGAAWAVVDDAQVAEFAGAVGAAAKRLAADDHARAHAGAHVDVEHAVLAAGGSVADLRESHGADVVFDGHGHAQGCLQRRREVDVAPAEVDGEQVPSMVGVDRAGRGDADTQQRVTVNVGGAQQCVQARADRVDHRLGGVRRRELEALGVLDLGAQVAGTDADKANADLHAADDERVGAQREPDRRATDARSEPAGDSTTQPRSISSALSLVIVVGETPAARASALRDRPELSRSSRSASARLSGRRWGALVGVPARIGVSRS